MMLVATIFNHGNAAWFTYFFSELTTLPPGIFR
jgi:hypothetical protein